VFGGIAISAIFQWKTLREMKAQTRELLDSTKEMREQTREMREATRNEWRPVLFVTIGAGDDPYISIGNHGRNPAIDLRLEIDDHIRDRNDRPLGEHPLLKEGYPLLPGGYVLRIDLKPNLAFDHFYESMIKALSEGNTAQRTPHLKVTIRYRDAITKGEFVEEVVVPVATELEGFTLAPLEFQK
jgi:hypothetical protein